MPTALPDALLVLSFGGPEHEADVLPFLENVTRGRGVPRERLAEVAQHYFAVGGVSPINDCNRALVAALRAELLAQQLDLPVYWGNRNWAPYLADVVDDMVADGVKRVAVFTTSAYSSYSSCRQYREDLFAATAGKDIAVTRLPGYCHAEGFVTPFAEATRAALAAEPGAHVVFVTHSIPRAMNDASGGPGAAAYEAQHLEVARRVATEAQASEWTLAYCSRSGPASVPWLEPDVNDHLADLAAAGVTSVVVVPIGFVCDHMEVVHDLDVEARHTAAEHGLGFQRVSTPGTHPAFVSMVVASVRADVAATCGGAACCLNPQSSREVVA